MTSFYSCWVLLLSIAPALFSSYRTSRRSPRVTAVTSHSLQLWLNARRLSTSVGSRSMNFIGTWSGKSLPVGGVVIGLGIVAAHYTGTTSAETLPPADLRTQVRLQAAETPFQHLIAAEMTERFAFLPEAVQLQGRHVTQVIRVPRVHERLAGTVLRHCAHYAVGQLGPAILGSDALKEGRQFKLKSSAYVSDHKVVPVPTMGTRG